MAFVEVAGDLGRSALAGAQEGSGVGLELGDVDGAALARRVLTSWLRRGGEGRAAVALLRGMGRVPCRLAASAAPGLVGSPARRAAQPGDAVHQDGGAVQSAASVRDPEGPRRTA